MLRPRFPALPAVVPALWLATAGPVVAQSVAVVGGEVHVGDGSVLQAATVLIEDGKIAAVGPEVAVPDGATVIEAAGTVLTPGFVDSLTLLGTGRGAGGALVNVAGEAGGMIAPAVRAADRFAENLAPEWLRDGVTAAYLAPDPRRLMGGVGAVVKLAGARETALLAEEVSVAASFAESAVGDSPPGRDDPTRSTTRQGMIYELRDTLVSAGEDEFTGAVGRTLGRLLVGELPLRMLANNPDDIETAIRVAEEFELRLVLDQAAGAAAVRERLARAGIPVIVGPSMIGIGDGGPMELYAHSPATPGMLHEAGVRVALSTFARGGRSVAMEAALAWAHGLPREAALVAVTGDAAQILGVADRIGTLAPGLDADLVIWDQHPISSYATAMRVIVDGETVFER